MTRLLPFLRIRRCRRIGAPTHPDLARHNPAGPDAAWREALRGTQFQRLFTDL